jgi:hypothetical protein
MRPRTDPPPPLAPGPPEQRAPEDLRHGGRACSASLVVATGPVVWHLGPTRPRADCAAHLAQVVPQRPEMPRDAWRVEHLHPHAVCWTHFFV